MSARPRSANAMVVGGGVDLLAIAGCNQPGVTHARGYGRLISEIVLDGAATLTDPAPFRLKRFEEPVERLNIADAATEAVSFA